MFSRSRRRLIVGADRHPECEAEDCCQLKEHKGYDSCQRAGECLMLRDLADLEATRAAHSYTEEQHG
jgi:hypothetical protein